MGATRTITFDCNGEPYQSEPPRRGDVLHPCWPRGRAWYLVIDGRPVESRVHEHRYRLTVRRVEKDEIGRGVGLTVGARLIPYTIHTDD